MVDSWRSVKNSRGRPAPLLDLSRSRTPASASQSSTCTSPACRTYIGDDSDDLAYAKQSPTLFVTL